MNDSSIAPAEGRDQNDHESRKRCNHHHQTSSGWSWRVVGGPLVRVWMRGGGARWCEMVHLPIGEAVQLFRFGNCVPETLPDRYNQAGITEDGSCCSSYAHPNTFRAERDGRFNWSSLSLCLLHVTEPERGVIVVCAFSPLPFIIISCVITGTIKKNIIIYIGDRHNNRQS